jgi:hypothetical protein
MRDFKMLYIITGDKVYACKTKRARAALRFAALIKPEPRGL